MDGDWKMVDLSGIPEDVVQERVLNLIEMVVRNFDCWLSCAAHLVILDEHGNEIANRDIQIGSEWSAIKSLGWRGQTPARVDQSFSFLFSFSFVFFFLIFLK